MILVCIMKNINYKQKIDNIEVEEDKAYFTSGNLNNMKSINVDKLIKTCILGIEGGIEAYQQTGSSWQFKQVDKLEIHTIEYNPTTKGSSYIQMRNALFGVYLDIFILKKEMNIN